MPRSRIISPYQVQSDYNFTRGGDLDELRIYDRMLNDSGIVKLARGEAPGVEDMSFGDETTHARFAAQGTKDTDLPFWRMLGDSRTRAEWWLRYGFNQPPPALPAGQFVSIRKVEIHDAFDLGRWWWKANDGIRETTWPGVYNRSRLPGRNDYFQLPDWDCYVDSGRAVTFTLPNEPWNHVEISGAAWGTVTEQSGTKLFERSKGHEHTAHVLAATRTGGKITFTNAEQETPIGELAAYHVSAGREPAGSAKLEFHLQRLPAGRDDSSLRSLEQFIAGRFPVDEAAPKLYANDSPVRGAMEPNSALPFAHVLIPNRWDNLTDGLDGIAIDLPAQEVTPTHGELFAVNIQVKDPLWLHRNLLDFTFSLKPGEPRTLWLDLRDRLLPAGKPLYLTLAGAGSEAPGRGRFGPRSLEGAKLRLVFKPRDAARAEHELDRFTQLRDSYAMLVEEHPNNPRLDLWNRFKGDLDDLLRVNPNHLPGQQYRAAAVLGAPRPPYSPTPVPAGVPGWAHRQVELLGWAQQFVDFYIDRRQSAYGDLGGGISDDTDLTNLWPGLALMGSEPEKIKTSLRRLLEAAYRNGMFTDGLSTIQTDELHSYEEGINCLAQNLLVDPGNPQLLERAMETARGIERVTGVNAAGHRHFRSAYFSGTRVATEDPWGWARPYSHLVLHVPQLLVDYNGHPAAKKYLVELADGLLPHTRSGAGGRGRGGSVPAIHFATDREADISRGTFPWHVFWAAWKFTGDRRYLAPLNEGGNALLQQVNANTLDQLDRRRTTGAPAPQSVGDTRPGGRATNFRSSSGEHFAWQLDGDKSRLEKLYAAQVEACASLHYINTEGSLWIDRVSVPTAELQRARLGGVALIRNALYPGHTVSWNFAAPATARSVAILIPDATPGAFTVIAHNLEASPVRATMTGWDVAPGTWEIAQGVDANNDDRADGDVATRTAPFERTRSLDFTLPPKATTILTLRLKQPAKSHWERCDLGFSRDDIAIEGANIRVRVHGLGSVASPATTLALRGADGRVVATAAIPALGTPADFRPRTVDVTLRAPVGTNLAGASVVADPEQRLDEITTANNAVKL